ncbi:hypothetical protein BDV19DRAFT_388055 [Aspergillus venezuelensis]
MPNTIYLVTGTNRRIGLDLVKSLLARPSTTIIASVRNDEASTTLKSELASITKGENKSLTTTVPDITHTDILIANADLRAAFEINTIAPLLVFQAFWPLLQRAKSGAPKAIFLTSSIGSIGGHEPVPGGAYGASRAAGNWLTRAINVQHEADGLVAVALHPGWVKTRAGNFVAEEWGTKVPPCNFSPLRNINNHAITEPHHVGLGLGLPSVTAAPLDLSYAADKSLPVVDSEIVPHRPK